jgi:hypothetical protein
MSAFFATTGSGKAHAPVFIAKSTAKAAPNVVIAECQLNAGCQPCAPQEPSPATPFHGGLCDCDWVDMLNKVIIRSTLSSMSLGYGQKVDPNFCQNMLNRKIAKVFPDFCEEPFTGSVTNWRQTANGPLWQITYEPNEFEDDETTEEYDWPTLAGILVDDQLEIGDEKAALEAARLVGRTFKPGWIRDGPVACFEMDGRMKRFHSMVCYNKSGGMPNKFGLHQPRAVLSFCHVLSFAVPRHDIV